MKPAVRADRLRLEWEAEICRGGWQTSDLSILEEYMNPPRSHQAGKDEAIWPSLLAFYAYARPEPPGLAGTSISPAGAYYERELSDFILPYEVVRGASSPDVAVLEFYQSAYDAGATLARWDRAALVRPLAEWP